MLSSPVSAQQLQGHAVGGSIGAAFDRGGFQFGVTGRSALTPRLTGAATLEMSPWFNLLSADVSLGTLNGYLSLAWSWATTEAVSIRSVVHLGVSMLLFAPVGADRFSVGPFAGLALLSISIRVSPTLTVELTPDATLSIPSVTGVPLVYNQYRLMASLLRWF